jgi:hypothetical protein
LNYKLLQNDPFFKFFESINSFNVNVKRNKEKKT